MSKELANKPIIAQYLERYKDQIAAALPKHLTPDRMSRIVMTEIRKVPKLLGCDPKSLFGAVIQASQLGLEPGSALGQCHLIPYGKDVQLIMGYRGMISLARRSGEIKSIEARAVYDGDDFEFSFGLNPDLKHTPRPGADRSKKPTHFYAVAQLIGGGVQWDVMSLEEVCEIRDKSQGYVSAKKYGKATPWDTHLEEMGKKTVIRRLFKYLPVSIEIQSAVGLDEQADAGVRQRNDAIIEGDFTTFDDVCEESKTTSKAESLKSKLSEKIDKNTGEILEQESVGLTADDVILMIKSADNTDDLDAACDLIRELDAAGAKRARTEAAKARTKLDS